MSARPTVPRLSWALSPWRREALRTTLWVVPLLLLTAAVVLFAVTYAVDEHVYRHQEVLPSWVRTESADGARQLLSALAAGVITVLGVVFSVTIVALTLASQQFGPRMLRNFIRDLGTQVTLASFVATFVYAVLTLGAIGGGSGPRTFVPQVSVAVSLVLVLLNVLVLIYFIHHITVSIQLPVVISSIAGNLSRAIDVQFPPAGHAGGAFWTGRGVAELEVLLATEGSLVTTAKSGYLQFVGYQRLVDIAARYEMVVQLLYRPGHFVTHGLPLARVWPPAVTDEIAAALNRSHVTGPHRTLDQDPVFAIDQLVEIAIRALSPAVNDTFTALTCIDWLADGLCTASERPLPDRVHRDRSGAVRVIEVGPDYARMVNRAYDKIRQAGAGMPAVAIRLLESLLKVLAYTRDDAQRAVLLRQAEMITRAARGGVDEPGDLAEINQRYERLRAALAARRPVDRVRPEVTAD